MRANSADHADRSEPSALRLAIATLSMLAFVALFVSGLARGASTTITIVLVIGLIASVSVLILFAYAWLRLRGTLDH